jgi:hypothetical protein
MVGAALPLFIENKKDFQTIASTVNYIKLKIVIICHQHLPDHCRNYIEWL